MPNSINADEKMMFNKINAHEEPKKKSKQDVSVDRKHQPDLSVRDKSLFLPPLTESRSHEVNSGFIGYARQLYGKIWTHTHVRQANMGLGTAEVPGTGGMTGSCLAFFFGGSECAAVSADVPCENSI